LIAFVLRQLTPSGKGSPETGKLGATGKIRWLSSKKT